MGDDEIRKKTYSVYEVKAQQRVTIPKVLATVGIWRGIRSSGLLIGGAGRKEGIGVIDWLSDIQSCFV